ncbi:hypothetical protein, partial [Acinetobacter baumannii]|uniref:hypothetical protein n=1 Tax=Acinetobacter baumannii TaxID=470 RepID=UPI00300D68A4
HVGEGFQVAAVQGAFGKVRRRLRAGALGLAGEIVGGGFGGGGVDGVELGNEGVGRLRVGQ